VLERGCWTVCAAATVSPPVRLTASRSAAWLCRRCSCPGGGGQEAAEIEVVNAVERGDQVQAGGPQRQLSGGGEQRHHPRGAAAGAGRELGQHGRRDVGCGQQRPVRQQLAQQPRVPSRPAAGIQAGDGAVRQELADRAHRRLIGGAQRFTGGRYPPEMIAHGHVRHLPHTGPARDHHPPAMPSSPTVHPRPAGSPHRCPAAYAGRHEGKVTVTGLATRHAMSTDVPAASP
jgi:hypothetical protein